MSLHGKLNVKILLMFIVAENTGSVNIYIHELFKPYIPCKFRIREYMYKNIRTGNNIHVMDETMINMYIYDDVFSFIEHH